MRHSDESEIVGFYKGRDSNRKPKLKIDISDYTLTNLPTGLGDTMILTDLPRAGAQAGRSVSVFHNSASFPIVMRYNPFYRGDVHPFWVSACSICQEYDLGNGHFIQRLRRAYGFTPELRPRPCLEVPVKERQPGGVILHLEPGSWVEWQRKNIHPRAREIYPTTFRALQRFIFYRRDLVFAEIGARRSGLLGVLDLTGLALETTIHRMAGYEYFLGITSGPLHIAAALGLKIVNIVNFPSATEICLPVLKDVGMIEAEWLYPDSVVLHQDDSGNFVKKLDFRTLQQAFDGELYPYFSDRYLHLINETTVS
ncbi:hypothetical protein LB565_18730 [Mesorhizobium sp. CA14]|uniref:hypothetical protein n=1 Tax=Mesorhizobium sp. CA14 TaxID=2876642 RepID=UPI001CCCEA2F|nr:hypothetical protein [Mesorhizobium sp. CA14]MBZ9850022.1 hypothetical protein [Mesorhizobium sp. CA14]